MLKTGYETNVINVISSNRNHNRLEQKLNAQTENQVYDVKIRVSNLSMVRIKFTYRLLPISVVVSKYVFFS